MSKVQILRVHMEVKAGCIHGHNQDLNLGNAQSAVEPHLTKGRWQEKRILISLWSIVKHYKTGRRHRLVVAGEVIKDQSQIKLEAYFSNLIITSLSYLT